MPRTRTSKATTVSVTENEETSKAPILQPPESNPPKVFVLPDNVSRDARIITLPDPARSKPTRYLICPERGFFEFSRLAAEQNAQPRSWLIVDKQTTDQAQRNGYVTKNQSLFVATPFDVLFFLLLLVLPKDNAGTGKKALFKVLDDYVDSAPPGLARFSALLRDQRYRTLFEDRLRTVCDVMEAGDETMFRVSQDKIVSVLQAKAERLVKKGLPTSLEEKFVSRALMIPVSGREQASTKIKESEVTGLVWRSEIAEDTSGGIVRGVEEGADSNPLATPSITIPTNILTLLRTRVALSFILRSYVQTHLHGPVNASTSSLDFTPLDLHLTHIAEVRGQAQALRTISNNIGRKRTADEDEPVNMEEIKRQKKEEEDKKKKLQSFGVKALAKVNTSGMKKMSSFFIKKGKA